MFYELFPYTDATHYVSIHSSWNRQPVRVDMFYILYAGTGMFPVGGGGGKGGDA